MNELKEATARYSASADRAAKRMEWLTWAILALTVASVAAAIWG